MARLYNYVGPAGIEARVAARPAGTRISSAGELFAWVRRTGEHARPDRLVVTFVIDEQGNLPVADRRSEHVGCAGGGPVLSAGEMFFRVVGDRVEVAEASNQSTGYCPEPTSWPPVEAALDRIGVPHPARFTTEVVFRRCETCGERSVVKDAWFVCGVCGAVLPAAWNF